MMKAVIERIESVTKDECRVALKGMRKDLSQSIRIVLGDIPSWYGVDGNGKSMDFELKAGTTIYFDRIFPSTRRMEHPKFTE